MHTHFLGTEEVEAYLRDVGGRLLALGPDMPTVWVPIGESGRVLAKRLLRLQPKFESQITIIPVEFVRNANRENVDLRFEKTASRQLNAKNVFVLDSSVHSGTTMAMVLKKADEYGAAGVCSYSLVMKRSSMFVPSFWGLMIDDHDRAYFLLNELPNNHFINNALQNASKNGDIRTPYFHIRKLDRSDLKRPRVKCNLASLDRHEWADMYYEMRNSDGDFWAYVLEVGNTILGYITFALRKGGWLSLETIAVDPRHQGKGYCSALARWAETMARQSRCSEIRLWAIENKTKMYEGMGYKTVTPEDALELDDGKYIRMTKRILYHIRLPRTD